MKWILIAATLTAAYAAASLRNVDNEERAKADDARLIVTWIAEANRKAGVFGEYATGALGPNHPLSKAPGIQDIDWRIQSYDFFAASDLKSCIVASAKRKTTGPNGTTRSRYAKRGFCANQTGDIAPLDENGNCKLDCLVDALGPM